MPERHHVERFARQRARSPRLVDLDAQRFSAVHDRRVLLLDTRYIPAGSPTAQHEVAVAAADVEQTRGASRAGQLPYAQVGHPPGEEGVALAEVRLRVVAADLIGSRTRVDVTQAAAHAAHDIELLTTEMVRRLEQHATVGRPARVAGCSSMARGIEAACGVTLAPSSRSAPAR